MALDFTIVSHVRHQFGNTDVDIGVFAGREQTFSFDCPLVSSDHALLLFQSSGVSHEQVLEVNGETVFGGVPQSDDTLIAVPTPGPQGSEHYHSVVPATLLGWVGNVLIINPGVLKDSGNVLRIASDGDAFVVDNVVVLYKTRRTGPVIGGSVVTDQ